MTEAFKWPKEHGDVREICYKTFACSYSGIRSIERTLSVVYSNLSILSYAAAKHTYYSSKIMQ